jgi:type I restriction enzyme S subunit
MTYQISQNINRDKIFIVNRSEIDGRLDPKMALYNKKVRHALYPLVKLKNMLLEKPQYGANEAGIIRENNIQPRYIRITDIDENGLISANELGATIANAEKKYVLNENDILIARSGATVGKAYIHRELPYTCLYAGYLIRFIVNPEIILPDYLFAYTQLNPYKEWVNAIQRPSAQPNINAEEYQSLEIPLPNLNKQREIVEYINEAYRKKQIKDKEAQQLLNVIDSYLLKELGITIPDVENRLENRIFLSSFSKIEGNRIDPVFSLYLGKNASSSKYENISLRSIAHISKGNALSSSNVEYGDIPVIAGGQTSPYFHNQSNYDGNIITVSASGAYAGYVWYHDYPIFATDCCVIFSKDESRFMTKYLFEVLKLQQKSIYKSQTGAAQPHIYATDLQMLNIPNVSIETQQEIIYYVADIRTRAKELQEEGRTILENAKREVEQMIIEK